MIPTIIIAVTTFLLVILSILLFPHIRIGKFRLDTYWMIALLGAVILLVFSFAPIQEVGKQLTSNASINPLKILVLFFSMTSLIQSLSLSASRVIAVMPSLSASLKILSIKLLMS